MLGVLLQIAEALTLTLTAFFLIQQIRNWLRFRSNASWFRSIPFDIRETFSFGSLRNVNFFGRSFSEKYGPIYRVHSVFEPVIILASSKLAGEFYKHCRTIQRGPEVSLLGQVSETVLGKCMAALHGTNWQGCRNAFRTGFQTPAVNGNYEMIQREISKWKAKHVRNRVVLDVHESGIDELPLTILTRVVYGEDMSEEEIQQIIEFGREHIAIMDASLGIKETLPFYRWLPWSLEKRAKRFREKWYRYNFEKYEQFLRLDQRTAESKTDVFSNAARYYSQQNGELNGDNLKQFFDTLDEILLLNIDVTYVALMNVLALVATHKNVLEELRAEIRNSTAFGATSVDFETLSKFPYLDAVFKESVRLRPPLTLSFPERSSEAMVLDGYHIPAGTAVMIDADSINHDPSVWPNPNTFDPLRFIDNKDSSVEFQYFKYGLNRNRRCLGFRYAEVIVKQAIWEVLSTVKIEIAEQQDVSTWLTKAREHGLPFFTPYCSFPKLKQTLDYSDLQLAPVFRLDDGVSARCFQVGETALQNRGNVLFGMSFGNSYYTEDCIKSLVSFLAVNFDRVFIDVPDEWTKHTYIALGYEGAALKRKLKYLTSRLRKHCQLGVEIAVQSGVARRDQFIFMDWGKDVENSPVYQHALVEIWKAYRQCADFREDCSSTTRDVLRSQGRDRGWANKTDDELVEPIETAVTYVLMELAEAVAFDEISSRLTGEKLSAVPAAMVYHRRWPVLEKFLNMEYDNEILKKLVADSGSKFGFLIFEARPTKKDASDTGSCEGSEEGNVAATSE